MDVDSTGGPWTYLGKHRANRCPAERHVMKQKELAYCGLLLATGLYKSGNIHVFTHAQHTHNTNIKSTMLYHASNMLRARTQHHSLTLPYDSSNSRPSKVGCLLSYRCSTAVNSGLRCRECWRWRHHHEGIRRGTSHHHSALAGHFFSSPMEPVGPVDTLKPGPNWLMISNLFVHTVYDMICILHMWDVHSTLI